MSNIKNGVILTGGTGSRLFPLTSTINKHLLNVGNKFIIDYPIQTLKSIGVENLTVVLGGNHFEQIVEYLQDGSGFELNVNYVYQKNPGGISQAINLCRRHLLDKDNFACILGDNIYQEKIDFSNVDSESAGIVLTKHPELKRFGVASIDEATGKILEIKEKPEVLSGQLKNLAITGCYLLTQEFFEFFKKTKPSSRNEFEITEILQLYNNAAKLTHSELSGWWIDAGTFGSVAKASSLLSKNS